MYADSGAHLCSPLQLFGHHSTLHATLPSCARPFPPSAPTSSARGYTLSLSSYAEQAQNTLPMPTPIFSRPSGTGDCPSTWCNSRGLAAPASRRHVAYIIITPSEPLCSRIAEFHGLYSNPFPDPYSISFSALLRRLSGPDPHSPHPADPPPVPHAIHPTLSTLTVPQTIRLSPHSSPFTAAVIRTLHPLPPPDVPLCPRLQRLELSWIEDCPDGLCTAMLRARWGAQAHANGVASLEWARIEFEGGIHDRDQMDMKKLCAEGMQGEIRLRDPE
ncbi:hypothetical protein BD779DRAFT_1784083 [Infundibulicybe gibba]|nr:hypothetical protein BD779DRAFT_1784083 [Infundibulicybe gibba]